MKKVSILLAVTVCCFTFVASAGAMTYIAEPVLVTQPVYDGMSFYVYRPYNMPAGWFVTYDGYPVSQLQGRWVYGLPNGCGGWSPSSYVVGSVVPTAVPQLIPVENLVSHHVTTPVSICAEKPMPQWLTNTYFTAVAGWNRVVDRMAVLHSPRIPLAWKGDKPEVLYAWTGQSWYQMRTKTGESPAETLKRNVYALTCMVHQNGFRWDDGDTAILAAQAPLWGYLWMGRIAPINL